ncbi:hypothetical protein Asulf_00399 [Archaeoglobus sulfaticallidus PM70-1]|uniref:DUF22 domain-containing protein n=1 Tax=Archaeoglobus sulfaticallidus PM70-1 TaxID=387631 RepID=N0BIX7_9EURY|nr:DUF22 domain-containing protein [Archaeoglobus sulfaticallidus]AGK60426.1 hypothetical protein Asulf_00399 [Archaeoglobus sulfaticallidus PM70-1]
MEVTISYRKDSEVVYEKANVEEAGYFLGPVAYFVNIVADEDVEVKANRVKVIKVQEFKISGNERLTLLDRYRHALGTLVAVVEDGKPERIDVPSRVKYVVFYPIADGKILKGSLIGVGVVTTVKKEAKEAIVEKLREVDKAISIDPEVFVKSDWPYLWKK